jgi:hypothetical protein
MEWKYLRIPIANYFSSFSSPSNYILVCVLCVHYMKLMWNIIKICKLLLKNQPEAQLPDSFLP